MESVLVSEGRVGLDSRIKADMLKCQFSSVFTKEDLNHLLQKNPSPYPVMYVASCCTALRTLRPQDTSAPRHFGTYIWCRSVPDTSAPAPKCRCGRPTAGISDSNVSMRTHVFRTLSSCFATLRQHSFRWSAVFRRCRRRRRLTLVHRLPPGGDL